MHKKIALLLLVALLQSPLWAQGDFYRQLAESAQALTHHKVVYDPAYYRLPYPGGDVPPDRGVCTDVIIRAYRPLGIDLQQAVHEDMQQNFAAYPKNWGLKKPDPNIDHRRVPNLMVFFSRHGAVLEKSRNAQDYVPGDIVAWSLGGGITHIGLVSGQKAPGAPRYLIAHNIGAGQVLEDMLFDFPVIGHYRYGGKAGAR